MLQDIFLTKTPRLWHWIQNQLYRSRYNWVFISR